MYVDPNFRTKKSLKEAVEAGKEVIVFQPGGIFPTPTKEQLEGSWVSVEGPWFPKPHTWYARVLISQGKVVKVK